MEPLDDKTPREIDLASIDHLGRRFVEDLLQRKGIDPGVFCTRISARDEMFWKALLPGHKHLATAFFRYTESALRTFDVYRQLVAYLGGPDKIGRVLDFGSGWGRLTRSVVTLLPPAHVWVSDIYHDAVAWQAETFGVPGLVSVTDPRRFALQQRHSIVFVGSVFSHLPEELFHRWLAKLYSLVAPDGLLAFSVHAEALVPDGHAMGADGLLFLKWSESSSLEAEVYGMAYVTEAFMAQAIARLDPERQVDFRHFPKGLYENQDLYVVGGPQVDLSSLDLRVTPMGGLRGVRRAQDSLLIDFWGMDFDPRHQLDHADIFFNDRQILTVQPTLEFPQAAKYFPGLVRSPVQGTALLPAEVAQADGLLRIELVSGSGASAHYYIDLPPFDPAAPGTLAQSC